MPSNKHTTLGARPPQVFLLVLGYLQRIASLAYLHQLPSGDILHRYRGHLKRHMCYLQPGGPSPNHLIVMANEGVWNYFVPSAASADVLACCIVWCMSSHTSRSIQSIEKSSWIQGTYSPSPASTTCTNCPAGTSSSASGAASSTTCAPCSTGSTSLPGGALCFPCNANAITSLSAGGGHWSSILFDYPGISWRHLLGQQSRSANQQRPHDGYIHYSVNGLHCGMCNHLDKLSGLLGQQSISTNQQCTHDGPICNRIIGNICCLRTHHRKHNYVLGER